MKQILFVICFFALNLCFAQGEKSFTVSDFISNECASNYQSIAPSFLDSSTGIWQVAFPSKPTINNAFQDNFALLTDSVNHYPINDSSSFIISLLDEGGFGDNVYGFPHTAYISGYYWSNTDSINDFGTLELKMPHVDFWIDLLADSIYSSYDQVYYPTEEILSWNSERPVFTGNSSGWRYFNLSLIPLASHYDVFELDTLQFRFSFHSDSIADTLDGLAFDELVFCDYVESLDEYSVIHLNIFPNPTNNELNVLFQQETTEPFDYVIENSLGEILLFGQLKNNKIDVANLISGVYFLRMANGNKISMNRFVKT